MASDFVRRVLQERKKRLLGTVLGHAERQVYPQLTSTQREAFRDCVLGAVGAYHDAALDLLAASINDGGLVNEEALHKLDEIHGRLVGG